MENCSYMVFVANSELQSLVVLISRLQSPSDKAIPRGIVRIFSSMTGYWTMASGSQTVRNPKWGNGAILLAYEVLEKCMTNSHIYSDGDAAPAQCSPVLYES